MAIISDSCLELNNFAYVSACLNGQPDHTKNDIPEKQSPAGYSVLQSALFIGDDLLTDEGICYKRPKLKRRRPEYDDGHCHNNPSAVGDSGTDTAYSLKGYRNARGVQEKCKFALGDHGYLTVLRPPTIPGGLIPVDWSPLLNTFGKEMKIEFNERRMGVTGEKHHSEYLQGVFLQRPLPFIIISERPWKD